MAAVFATLAKRIAFPRRQIEPDPFTVILKTDQASLEKSSSKEMTNKGAAMLARCTVHAKKQLRVFAGCLGHAVSEGLSCYL